MSPTASGSSTRQWDVVVIGGGHNGLVCSAYLARAGMSVLLLERRERVGGVLDSVPLAPGVPSPGLVHSVGRLAGRIAHELDLRQHGLRLVESQARLTSIDPSGRALTLWADTQRTQTELSKLAPADSAAYEQFDADTRAMAQMSARIARVPPPDVERLRLSDLTGAFGLLRGYRGLGSRRAHDYLRVLPMPIADHVADYFKDDQLRAALCWRGVRYTSMAASDAGSTQVFLADSAGTADGAAGEMTVALGGPAALADALSAAAKARGVEIRTGAEVTEVVFADGHARGVVLSDRQRINARAVVSGLDPKRTLLRLVDPQVLGPTLAWEADNLRLPGGLSAVELALGALPTFTGVDADEAGQRLGGRILIAPTVNVLDRAADAVKGGRVADDLVLEATIPTLLDPTLRTDGHLMSVLVHGTPYHLRSGDWENDRDALGDRVVAQLETVAPGLGALIVARRVVTPLDLERDYGLTEGHPLHGEPTLDQWFAWRPMLGLARYRVPLTGLYLCASGSHPGGGITGAPGRLAAQEILSDLRQGRLRLSA